jgi:8-oxo-dGTP pyrophosphatase MutT (NUDIX family)
MDDLKAHLKRSVSLGLPGHKAFFDELKAYEDRLNFKPDDATRTSAVMLLLFPKERECHLVLILRPSYNGMHSGQIALPGGKKDPIDLDTKHTAIRETYEEIGLKLTENDIIMSLSPVYITVSNFMVHPFLALINYYPDFKKDIREVEKIIEVPIKELLDAKNKKHKIVKVFEQEINVQGYELQSHWVWGATALILNEFKELYLRKV